MSLGDIEYPNAPRSLNMAHNISRIIYESFLKLIIIGIVFTTVMLLMLYICFNLAQGLIVAR